MTPFIDSNIFIRHIAADDPVQSPACLEFFRAVERGELVGWTSPLVVAEIVFVLSRVYNVGREGIRDAILPLLLLPGIRLDQKPLMKRVFELFVASSIDYVDAYHAALLEHQGGQLYSYDRHFDRVPGLQRMEP
jgi:predicted nucleic acid-binding protein